MKTEKDMTDWFAPRQIPKREGVYQRKRHASSQVIYYSRFSFNGRLWYRLCDTPEEAAKIADPSGYQALPWRGLVRPTE
jgi:hypothetical protein